MMISSLFLMIFILSLHPKDEILIVCILDNISIEQ